MSSSSSDEQEGGGAVDSVAVEIHEPPSSSSLPIESIVSNETLLGTDPKRLTNYGPPLDEALVARWQSFLVEGVDKESREEFSKILFPQNCSLLASPVMNSEAEKLLSALEKKKDFMFSSLQDRLGRGLTKLGEVISLLLSCDKLLAEDKAVIIPKAADSAKMLCEVHYLLSNHRKHQVYPYMNQITQKLAEEAKRDTKLFGSDFSEKCKTAQAVEKAAIDIKVKKPTFPKKQLLRNSSFYLNSPRQAPKNKMKSWNAFPRYHQKKEETRKTGSRTYRQEYPRQRR